MALTFNTLFVKVYLLVGSIFVQMVHVQMVDVNFLLKDALIFLKPKFSHNFFSILVLNNYKLQMLEM